MDCRVKPGNDEKGERKPPPHNGILRRRRALPMTETELKLMAAAAIMGLSSSPKTG